MRTSYASYFQFIWISCCAYVKLEMQTEFILRSLFFKCNAIFTLLHFFLSRRHGTGHRHLIAQTNRSNSKVITVLVLTFLSSYAESSSDSSVDTATGHLQHGWSSSPDSATIFRLRCPHPVTPTKPAI